MAKAIQRRRGTTAQHASFTGLAGELTYDTDKKTGVWHDGATAGGLPAAGPKATAAQVRAATADKGLSADHLTTASALVALTDAATVAVDWTAGINFSLTVTANRAIGNPTNGIPGTFRTITVQGDSGTDRTITFGNQFLGEVPTITDCDDARWYTLTIMCITASHFTVSSKKSKGT